LLEVPNTYPHEFIGAYGPHTCAVYARNGNVLQYLPDNLILDDALAVAKIIIMTHRSQL